MARSWKPWLLLSLFLVVPGPLIASPPACRRSAADRLIESDLIVEGRLVEARRGCSIPATIRL